MVNVEDVVWLFGVGHYAKSFGPEVIEAENITKELSKFLGGDQSMIVAGLRPGLCSVLCT